MNRRSVRRSPGIQARPILILLTIGLFAVIALCCAGYGLVARLFDGEGTPAPVSSSSLTIAYSPEKELLFSTLVTKFNEQQFEASDGARLEVDTVLLDPESMVNAVLNGDAPFQALSPDSSVWLGQLDEEWSQQQGGDAAATGETVRYAVSPVVIAMWEDLAREMGWPERSIGWQDLLNRAQADPDFRWSHPSTNSASGLLATLAEFYAGAGKTRGLTIEDVQAQETLDYVAALEKTVRYYGEGNEPALIEQALVEGRSFLDAFVVQEQMVIYFNTHRSGQDRLIALYPTEGTLWEDHPLALLETGELTPLQRQTFARFRDFVLSPEAQKLVLRHGYRPADLSIPLDSAESPVTVENGADPTEPETSLQVPNASVIGVVRDVWWYTKRHTNVYLVADTSGSMRGEKLDQAKEALQVFLDEIQGDTERVGLVQFASDVNTLVYMDELGHNRAALEAAVDSLWAEGDTALLDGVYEAYVRLQQLGDKERINAIVVMTDGRENYSTISFNQLMREMRNPQVPVLIFSVAYGSDADMQTLQAISEPSGGRVLTGDLETIRDLYRILSTYF
jgi:Ca-activated chloride channel family protein